MGKTSSAFCYPGPLFHFEKFLHKLMITAKIMQNLMVRRKNFLSQNPHPLKKIMDGPSLRVAVFDVFSISQTTEFSSN